MSAFDFGMAGDLAAIRLAKTDDTNAPVDFRETKDMHARMETTERDVARLALRTSLVDDDHRRPEVEIGGCFERQAAKANAPFVLHRIEFDADGEGSADCIYKKTGSWRFRPASVRFPGDTRR